MKQKQDRKAQEKDSKKEYENQLVRDLKQQIQLEKEKEEKKREELKLLAMEMKKDNEDYKVRKADKKTKQREMDV